MLPAFQQYAALFPQNDDIRRALCLFYEDILNLYAVLLKFTTNRSKPHCYSSSFPPR